MTTGRTLRLSRTRLSPLSFLAAGFLPVISIVLHCLGILSMQHCLLLLIIPLFVLAGCTGLLQPETGRTAWKGWLAGVLAVLLYDLSRVPFMLYGWNDFIPRIGSWLTGAEDPQAIAGYAWRYIGNGGGLGIAFFMLLQLGDSKKNLMRKGILFGLFVFGCLMLILTVFKEAQEMMFRITALTFSGSLTGHVVYGAVLGWMARRHFK